MKKEIGIALLRIGMGLLMLPHGFNKLALLLSREEITFPSVLGINPTLTLAFAVFAEVICALLLVFGFKTKWAAKVLIINMLIAIFYVHLGNSWGEMETAIIFLIGYLTVYFSGGGKYSADTAWNNFKKEQANLQLVEY